MGDFDRGARRESFHGFLGKVFRPEAGDYVSRDQSDRQKRRSELDAFSVIFVFFNLFFGEGLKRFPFL
ncbi:MAG: hypothetical protein QMD77_00055 [Patescibacteria group bacterium]|nr:hypothetical protein [Patescibacteria group bacterium]